MLGLKPTFDAIIGKVSVQAPTGWLTDIKPEVNCEVDALKFIFAQAEKKLDDSNKVFESTTNKSVTIITAVSAIFVAQSGYFFTHNNFLGHFNQLDAKLMSVFFSAIYTLILLRYLFNNLMPTPYHTIGSSPERLLTPSFFNKEIGEKVTSFLYITELEEYQDKIEYNHALNRIRLNRIRQGLKALIYLPFFGLSLFYVTSALLTFFF